MKQPIRVPFQHLSEGARVICSDGYVALTIHPVKNQLVDLIPLSDFPVFFVCQFQGSVLMYWIGMYKTLYFLGGCWIVLL